MCMIVLIQACFGSHEPRVAVLNREGISYLHALPHVLHELIVVHPSGKQQVADGQEQTVVAVEVRQNRVTAVVIGNE